MWHPKWPLPQGLWMSLQSNNYVVITQQTLFSPLMHLFRNHYCLHTMGADMLQKVCCPEEPLTPGFLLHHPPFPCSWWHSYGQGEDLPDLWWGLLPPVTDRPCMAKLIYLVGSNSRDCAVLKHKVNLAQLRGSYSAHLPWCPNRFLPAYESFGLPS